MAHADEIQPSLRAVAISETQFPKLLDSKWVAPNATVVGDVEVGKDSSLWFGTILRGEKAPIKIGKNSIVQDRTHIEDSTIGDSVFVGANAQVKGATLDSYSFVGPNSVIQEGSTVEGYALVAAGSVVESGTTVPTGQVWAGAPAQYLRDLTQSEKHMISEYKEEQEQMS